MIHNSFVFEKLLNISRKRGIQKLKRCFEMSLLFFISLNEFKFHFCCTLH